MGRRVEKAVYAWDTQAEEWAEPPILHRKFVWGGAGATGGWLLLLELDGDDESVRKYTWGLDLAGQRGSLNSLEGAGGIGGLLAVAQAEEGGGYAQGGVDAGDYVYFYDANGNVGQLVALASGFGGTAGDAWDTDPPTLARLVARYEYDAYGNVVGPDTNADAEFDESDDPGPYARANPFRFSTKPWDDETGLGAWIYRLYDPKWGRWLSRDPIGEEGGANLYCVLANRPTCLVDALGLQKYKAPVFKECGAFIVCPRDDIKVDDPVKANVLDSVKLNSKHLIGFEVIFLPIIPSEVGQYHGPKKNPQDCCCGCDKTSNIRLVQVIKWEGVLKGTVAGVDGAQKGDIVPPGMKPPGRTHDGSSFEDGPYNTRARYMQATANLEICAFCTVKGVESNLGCFRMSWTHGTEENDWKDRKFEIKSPHLSLTEGAYKGCTSVSTNAPGELFQEGLEAFPPHLP